MTCGVPQGFVLEPLLAHIYMNDIGEITKHAKMCLFADDTDVFIVSDDPIRFTYMNGLQLTNCL